MVLDAVLAARELTWLGTEREKVAYFVDQRQLSADDLPALTFSQAVPDDAVLPREAAPWRGSRARK